MSFKKFILFVALVSVLSGFSTQIRSNCAVFDLFEGGIGIGCGVAMTMTGIVVMLLFGGVNHSVSVGTKSSLFSSCALAGYVCGGFLSTSGVKIMLDSFRKLVIIGSSSTTCLPENPIDKFVVKVFTVKKGDSTEPEEVVNVGKKKKERAENVEQE